MSAGPSDEDAVMFASGRKFSKNYVCTAVSVSRVHSQVLPPWASQAGDKSPNGERCSAWRMLGRVDVKVAFFAGYSGDKM